MLNEIISGQDGKIRDLTMDEEANKITIAHQNWQLDEKDSEISRLEGLIKGLEDKDSKVKEVEKQTTSGGTLWSWWDPPEA